MLQEMLRVMTYLEGVHQKCLFLEGMTFRPQNKINAHQLGFEPSTSTIPHPAKANTPKNFEDSFSPQLSGEQWPKNPDYLYIRYMGICYQGIWELEQGPYKPISMMECSK